MQLPRLRPLARGETKLLLGLPMTVKEQFNIAGLPTTWGNPDAKGWQPQADALVVQRLKAAGAIILGKTNVPLMLSDWQSYNYGTTNNPWDLGRTPGGSSGGAAAALAAGYVPLELGSDIGGSLRAPAHYCGVFSHKPSLDLVPMRGAGPPRPPAVPAGHDLAVLGPMARTAQDLALELSVVAGPDELWDGIGYQPALAPPRHETLAEFRMLVLDEHPLCPTSHSVASALDTLAGQLGNAGCTVRRSDRTQPDLAFLTHNYVELLAADEEVTPDERARIQAAAAAIPPDDNRLTASYIRGATMPHPAVCGRVISVALCVRDGRRCSATSTSSSVRRCRQRRSVTITHRNGPVSFRSTTRRSTMSTRSHGPPWQRTVRFPRPPCRWRALRTVCRSGFRSSGPISTTARRSPSPRWWSESSVGSCGRPISDRR
jgi:hypothetical protein